MDTREESIESLQQILNPIAVEDLYKEISTFVKNELEFLAQATEKHDLTCSQEFDNVVLQYLKCNSYNEEVYQCMENLKKEWDAVKEYKQKKGQVVPTHRHASTSKEPDTAPLRMDCSVKQLMFQKGLDFVKGKFKYLKLKFTGKDEKLKILNDDMWHQRYCLLCVVLRVLMVRRELETGLEEMLARLNLDKEVVYEVPDEMGIVLVPLEMQPPLRFLILMLNCCKDNHKNLNRRLERLERQGVMSPEEIKCKRKFILRPGFKTDKIMNYPTQKPPRHAAAITISEPLDPPRKQSVPEMEAAASGKLSPVPMPSWEEESHKRKDMSPERRSTSRSPSTSPKVSPERQSSDKSPKKDDNPPEKRLGQTPKKIKRRSPQRN